jgi:MAM domain, meprin/A5/mu/Secretion system C-terminal sorting domain/PKD domain/Right handed beta helix region
MNKLLRLVSVLIVILSFGSNLNAQVISSFPYSEDFESFVTCSGSCNSPCALGNFWLNEQSGGDAGEWTTDIGGTSSGLTGPSMDYNPGTTSGKYLYLESSSPCYPNVTAIMYSPAIDLTGVTAMNFVFANHMYGTAMGSMYVDVSTDSGAIWTNEWSKSGDQGDVWSVDTVNLNAYVGNNILVRFRGVTTTAFTSDMAIDDIYIYEPLALDAGVVAIPSPGLPSCNLANSNVTARVNNFGYDTLASVTINWAVNSILQTPYTWIGILLPSSSFNQVIGIYSFIDGDSLDVWTSNPNGISELGSGSLNDSTNIVITSGMYGTYTIGSVGDYTDFTSALADLNSYGVCSPVVFDVASGIYNEQITINEIAGASEINTITFQSLNQDPALVTLTYPSTGTSDNFVINMDGGDFFTFKEITIANTGTSYGRAIFVQNGASVNQWLGNIITGDTNIATTSTYMALVFSDASIDTSNVFDGNVFENGSYSMYYNGGGTTSLENGTVISNNIFNNFYYRGVNLFYQNDMEVSGNTFVPNTLYTGSINRMYLSNANGSLRVNNNKMEGNKYGYGIYLVNSSGLGLDKAYIYNNFIHIGDSLSTSTSYGIYLTGCNNQVVANNSINIESLGTSSRALYVTGGSNNDILNNILRNNGPGYGYYYVSGISSSENNNVYVPNGSPFYFGGAIPDLATWQIATGFDLASSEEDPMFVSSDDLHTCQELSINAGALPIGMIVMDIDGQLRDANTPDIGADEFLGLSNLAFPEDSIWKCANDTVVLGGWEPTDGATYLWSTNDTTPTISTTLAGTYSVEVTTTCGTDTIGDVEVMNIPDAVANFTTISSFMTAVCTNNSTGADSYLWDFGDGTSSTDMSPTHVYLDTGSFVITLIVTGPCGSDTTTQLIYSTTIGIDEIPTMTAFNVYPNPNKGEFTIDFALNETNEVSFELINMLGQCVWNSSLGMIEGKHSENVSVKGQAPGIYLLKVVVGDRSLMNKLIIE